MRIGLLTLTGFFLALPAWAQQAAPEALHKPNRDFAAALNAKDVAAILQTYSDDAIVMPPNAEPIKGKAGIEAFWKGMIDQGLTVTSIYATASSSAGAWGYESGIAELSVKPGFGSPALDTIKYVTVLKKDKDGAWKIVQDIWNSNLSAPR
jgi:ketosteroid isomerase-like protein